jgi:hypothetical protein
MVIGCYYDWEGRPISQDRWVSLFADERHVGQDTVGDVWVSTLWFGLSHRSLGRGPPLIFETMVSGGEYDGWTWRYATEREAREGHAATVELVREDLEARRPGDGPPDSRRAGSPGDCEP